MVGKPAFTIKHSLMVGYAKLNLSFVCDTWNTVKNGFWPFSQQRALLCNLSSFPPMLNLKAAKATNLIILYCSE
jgi:hypothetical protein